MAENKCLVAKQVRLPRTDQNKNQNLQLASDLLQSFMIIDILII